jgi:CRISPR-associated exonuclease Cas4
MKISVSSIREFEFCPRAVYLKRVIKVEPSFTAERAGRLIKHSVRKELSMRQPELLRKTGGENLDETVRKEFETVINNLPTAYCGQPIAADINQLINEIRRELEPELSLISGRLQSMTKEYGLEKAISLITPVKVKCRMESEELGLKGIVDKVMNPLVPLGIKTGRAGAGVWDSDKLQLCAYGMLLEEQCETGIPYGLVEYTAIQEQRTVPFTGNLKEAVMETRESVSEVLSGKMPELCPHGNGRKCEACGFREACYRL